MRERRSMDKGSIVEVGEPETFFTAPKNERTQALSQQDSRTLSGA
jgi:hypothetical protein